MHVFDKETCNNSVKNCARDLIFVSKGLEEHSSEHAMLSLIFIFLT